MSDKRGLYGKYIVERTDGKDMGACFIIEFDDPHAAAALLAYADAVEADNPQLAADLREQFGDDAPNPVDRYFAELRRNMRLNRTMPWVRRPPSARWKP